MEGWLNMAQKSTLAPKKRTIRRKKASRYWSAKVTQRSDALDVEKKIFSSSDPRAIARSLKRSAEASKRRKATPFRSAMSMLTFYINRAGSRLSRRQKNILARAKQELRRVYGRA
jgi:putative cell wall-binding protein